MLRKMISSELKLNVVKIYYVGFVAVAALSLLVNNAIILLAAGCYVTVMYIPTVRNNDSLKFYDGLPVKRCKKYSAAVCVMLILEFVATSIAALSVGIGRLISNFTNPAQNILLLNLTALGAIFFAQGVANLITLPLYAYEKTRPILFSLPVLAYCSAFLGVLLPASLIVGELGHVESNILGNYNAEWLWLRAVIFAVGVCLFAVFTAIGYVIGKKLFAKRII